VIKSGSEIIASMVIATIRIIVITGEDTIDRPYFIVDPPIFCADEHMTDPSPTTNGFI
jgi:hypothetical protein